MKGITFILAVLALIAIATDFRVQAFPKPQEQVDDSSLTFADGFAFDGAADRQEPKRPVPTRRPQIQRTASPVTTTSTEAPSTTVSSAVTQCIRNCPTTSEYNPVCGSDGTVYSNPGKLTCARACGVDVSRAFLGPCESDIRG